VGEKLALNVGPSKIKMAYERLGNAQAPPVVLIQGVAAQLINWPDGFCAELVAHGLQLIRFDNRDVGLSSHFPNAPIPDLPAALGGDLSSASYTLSDMAADTVGLLDALGLGSAHIVGLSMGHDRPGACDPPPRAGQEADIDHVDDRRSSPARADP